MKCDKREKPDGKNLGNDSPDSEGANPDSDHSSATVLNHYCHRLEIYVTYSSTRLYDHTVTPLSVNKAKNSCFSSRSVDTTVSDNQ